jgi:hypothetical protein
VIYVYQHMIQGQQRVQEAWGKWVFNSYYDIDDIEMIEDTLFMLSHDTNQHKRIFEKIELSELPANIDIAGGQSLPAVTC